MAKFKVGDKIHIPEVLIRYQQFREGEWLCSNCEGLDVFIHKMNDEWYYYTISPNDTWSGDRWRYSCHEKITEIDAYCELVSSSKNKKTTMNKLTSMLKRLLDADSQLLYKAGFLNGDLEITEEGLKELNGILFNAYMPQLVEKAKEIIAEEEKRMQ